jgi:hypothetical protein
MCVGPIRLANGQLVACGSCSWCRSNRQNDFVGRCLAEQKMSQNTLALTLTYRGTGVDTVTLFYVDVQQMLKHLRNDGYSVRYICAGEYGEKKGRAHWHIVLFFKGSAPELPLASRVIWKYWPHGHVYAQHPDASGFKYLMKYTLKDDTQRGFQKVLRVSKKPPLGASYFAQLAQDMVSQRLAMHSPEYSFKHVTLFDKKRRKPVPQIFWLSHASLDLFLREYVSSWEAAYGKKPPPTEFLWEKYYDPIAREELLMDAEALERELERRRANAAEFARKVGLAWRDANASYRLGFLDLGNGVICSRHEKFSCLVITEGNHWLLDGRPGADVSIAKQFAALCDILPNLDPADLGIICDWIGVPLPLAGILPHSTTRGYRVLSVRSTSGR